jgi:UDP-glucose 4-epimerase
MKAILVTGGLGFIGSHTVVELVAAGYRPVIVDDLSNSELGVIERLQKLVGHDISFYQQDFQDIEKLRKIIEEEQISGIIHFAAFKAVGESVGQPLKYYQNNVAGFIELLTICEEIKIVKNLVFSSSCTVYGEPDSLPVTEDSPVKPAASPYGASKQMCEIILRDTTTVSSSFNSLALRYFNPIGAHSSALIGELPLGVPANLVPFVTQTAAGLRDKLTVYGNDYLTPDGTCIRDYVHVVDLAKAHVKALAWLENQPSKSYETLNIGTGKGSSVLEVIDTFSQVTGVEVPYEIGPRREGDLISTYASVDKARSLIDWQSEYDLAAALGDAWRWQQSLSYHK